MRDPIEPKTEQGSSMTRSKIVAGSAKKGVETVPTVLAEGQSREELLATLVLSTVERNAVVSRAFANQVCSTGKEPPDFGETTKIIAGMCGKVRQGNLDCLTDMLTAQALTLDTIFTDYTRRALVNAGQYPEAVERYTNLAAKAQSQCRATVETLARVKRGGKQTVKVVHVHEGGQAVVADTVNNGGQRGPNPKINEQPHEPVAALPSPDPSRDGVPVPGDARKEALPAARGQVAGSAKRKPQRLETRGKVG
ncbi:hypothetical protein H8M03_02545 [Sphingomonas sabuli]|uniref:Uncharacterized protein n=1 Tax=Sphingomonas sabuli TaxID=2764186 RepID=A0A7G9L3P9_9SPHN|nr:hypothetical protein [Sphingomonas sabuli]QNM83248.1 hypothetical protein H8M03_02545 [Sphingomonas sabuli]